ncbi:MAG: DUF2934 domain-containing protein [Steroidobacteraceae bacterium]
MRAKHSFYFRPPAFNPLRFSLPVKRVSAEERRRMIAQAAYFRAERRNFAPGRELEDWVAAEAEVDRGLARSDSP